MYPHYITRHAVQRFQERTDLIDRQSMSVHVSNALRYGKGPEFYSGACRRYLQERAGHCRPIVYHDLVLILAPGNQVVTVYPLPIWFAAHPRYNWLYRLLKGR